MEQENIRILPVGTVLNNQYEIKSLLGEGGFGITYKGFDRFLEIDVAIKEYFPAALATRDVLSGDYNLSIKSGDASRIFDAELKKFEYEANKISKLSKLPGIVKIYNFFFENNTAYMVMDFIEGISFKAYMKEHGNKLDWKEVLDMMHPVITSLQSIHESGIIHRDISPDNIMLTKDGKVSLIDFGAARYSEEDKSKTVVLKHGFAPPEQYYRDGNQGPWTDVYALCATLYILMTGKRPAGAMDIFNGVAVTEDVKFYVPTIPKNIDRAIMKGLSLDIYSRIKSMKELEEYLYNGARVKKKIITKKVIKTMVALLIGVAIMVSGFMLSSMDPDSSVVIFDLKPEISVSIAEETNSVKTAETSIEESGKENESEEDISAEDIESLPEIFRNLSTPNAGQISISKVYGKNVIEKINSSSVNIVVPYKYAKYTVSGIKYLHSNVVTVRLENGIEAIYSGAFNNCIYLENIYIPDSVTTIEESAFVNCLSLKGVTLSDGNKNFYIEDNALYSLDGKLLAEWK